MRKEYSKYLRLQIAKRNMINAMCEPIGTYNNTEKIISDYKEAERDYNNLTKTK